MIQYKCIIAYDGTDYHGWQVQPNAHTIAEALEDTFYKVFGTKIQLLGASRTDTGVHAQGQVARFFFDSDIPVERIHRAWSNRLPDSIQLRSLERVADDYHPHHGVLEKEYRYRFFLDTPPLFLARYGWHYPGKPNLKKLYTALQVFVGTHDFRSFCTGYEMNSTVRTVNSIELTETEGTYTVIVKGAGFLRYQIRRMVGAALEVASRPLLTIDSLQQVLNKKNAEHRLPTAPGHGLTLEKITYETTQPK